MPRDRGRGTQRGSYALDPALMAVVCRRLAADLRAEAAAGWPGLKICGVGLMSRAELAESMDLQAARWVEEARGGERNMIDREKIGMP